MMTELTVTDITIKAAGEGAASSGLLGYVSFKLNGELAIDGVTLRRTTEGRLCLSFPARTDGNGVQRFYIRPLSDEVRERIEEQVIGALGIGK